ncbi:hypothetical protein OAS73_01955 [Luminiphilus sp.]|nr:hypothetical protein [Luminiphilus sp.]
MKAIRLLGLVGCLVCSLGTPASWAVDPLEVEDYETSYKATRDAWRQAYIEYELAVNYYRIIRVPAVAAGVNPNDALVLSIIDGNNLTDTCQGANYFTDASLAMGQFITHASAYAKIADLEAFNSENEVSATAYRAGRDDKLRALDEGRGIAFIPAESADASDYQGYMVTEVKAASDAVMKAANELSLATPPYKAAEAAYKALTNTYTATSRGVTEFLVVRMAEVRKSPASPDPRLNFIEPLSNDLKIQ